MIILKDNQYCNIIASRWVYQPIAVLSLQTTRLGNGKMSIRGADLAQPAPRISDTGS